MSWTTERARVASLSRSRPADDPELNDARRRLAADNLTRYIERVLSAAPPLSEAQRGRLAALFVEAPCVDPSEVTS